MMDTNIIKELNPVIFNQYLSKEIDQHSVGMIYVEMDLAVNDPEMKEEYVVWNKHINNIGNKEKATEQGFFWAVKVAKLVEISCVLQGSNELTPTIENTKGKETTQEEKIIEEPSIFSKLARELSR